MLPRGSQHSCPRRLGADDDGTAPDEAHTSASWDETVRESLEIRAEDTPESSMAPVHPLPVVDAPSPAEGAGKASSADSHAHKGQEFDSFQFWRPQPTAVVEDP